MSEAKVIREMDVERNLCNYCGACVGMCPTDAVSMDDNLVIIHEEKCIKCAFCVVGCPTAAITAGWFNAEL